MSFHEWRAAQELHHTDPPFYALIMAAMLKADTINAGRLCIAFPGIWQEVQARYDAPGGRLEGEVQG